MRIFALKEVAANTSIFLGSLEKNRQVLYLKHFQHLNVKSHHLAFTTVLQTVAIKLWFLGSFVPKAKGCPEDKAACNPPDTAWIVQ